MIINNENDHSIQYIETKKFSKIFLFNGKKFTDELISNKKKL